MRPARLMREQHVGTLVVTCPTTRGVEVCGIVTDRELVVDAVARHALETDMQVADLASIIRAGREREIGERSATTPAAFVPRFPAVGTAAWTQGVL